MKGTAVTKPLKEVKEEVLTGISTPQAIIALVCLLAFAITLDRPGQVLTTSSVHKDLWVDSAKVLTDVDNMEPSKLLAQGNIDDAVGEATKEVNERPTDIRTVICAGNVLSQVGDKQKGFQLLRKSVDLAPQSFYVLLNYARRLAAGERTNEAVDQYVVLSKTYPKQIEPRFELANRFQYG